MMRKDSQLPSRGSYSFWEIVWAIFFFLKKVVVGDDITTQQCPYKVLSLQESLGARVTWPSCAAPEAESPSAKKKRKKISLSIAHWLCAAPQFFFERTLVGLSSLLCWFFTPQLFQTNLIHRTWEGAVALCCLDHDIFGTFFLMLWLIANVILRSFQV